MYKTVYYIGTLLTYKLLVEYLKTIVDDSWVRLKKKTPGNDSRANLKFARCIAAVLIENRRYYRLIKCSKKTSYTHRPKNRHSPGVCALRKSPRENKSTQKFTRCYTGPSVAQYWFGQLNVSEGPFVLHQHAAASSRIDVRLSHTYLAHYGHPAGPTWSAVHIFHGESTCPLIHYYCIIFLFHFFFFASFGWQK